MRNNCAKKFYAQYLRNLGLSFVNAQYIRKILSLMRNNVQDFTYSPNAQYMCKDFTFPQCAIYVQDLRKIVLLSPMRNFCARCTSIPNAQYMCKSCKIVLISPMRNTGCSKKFARIQGTVHCWLAV